jgi:hypothetical protein
MNILQGDIPIVDLIEDQDAEAAIYGAVLMHATRVLGNDVLRSLTSPMGDVLNHEGIVMRDDKLFGSNPVKITGDFIVGNLGGGFGQVNEEEVEIIDNEDADPVGEFAGGTTIALVPGAFKPPHRGHLGMVEEYANTADQVVVLISAPLKAGRMLPNGREITAQDSKKIWETLVSHLPNVSVEISSHASPITAVYDYIGTDGPLEPGTDVILGASTKEGDWKRWLGIKNEHVKEGIRIKDPESVAVEPTRHSPYYVDLLDQSPLRDEMPSVKMPKKDPKDFHASDMRYLLGKAEEDEEAVELLEDFTGEDNIFDVLSILGLNTGLNETSMMQGGDVSGGAAVGVSGGPWRRGNLKAQNKEEEERSQLKKENVDLSMVEEVLRLFIEKGIAR